MRGRGVRFRRGRMLREEIIDKDSGIACNGGFSGHVLHLVCMLNFVIYAVAVTPSTSAVSCLCVFGAC